MKTLFFIKKSRIFGFILATILLGSTILIHAMNSLPHHSIAAQPEYDFTMMLKLLKRHRSFSYQYHKNYALFVKNKKAKEQIEATLHKLYAEYRRLDEHIKEIKRFPTKDIVRKKIQSLSYYATCLSIAIKDLEQIKHVINVEPHKWHNASSSESLKGAAVAIELDSHKVVQQLLCDPDAHVLNEV